jgi:hypothetical protein
LAANWRSFESLKVDTCQGRRPWSAQTRRIVSRPHPETGRQNESLGFINREGGPDGRVTYFYERDLWSHSNLIVAVRVA